MTKKELRQLKVAIDRENGIDLDNVYHAKHHNELKVKPRRKLISNYIDKHIADIEFDLENAPTTNMTDEEIDALERN